MEQKSSYYSTKYMVDSPSEHNLKSKIYRILTKSNKSFDSSSQDHQNHTNMPVFDLPKYNDLPNIDNNSYQNPMNHMNNHDIQMNREANLNRIYDDHYPQNEMNYRDIEMNRESSPRRIYEDQFPMNNASYKMVKEWSEDDELEWTFEELVITFGLSQQLIMVAFFSLCLVLYCVKASFGNCMLFTFAVSNMINSLVYVLMLTIFAILIFVEEVVGQDTNTYVKFFLIFTPIVLFYYFYMYWSALNVMVSKTLIPSKEVNEVEQPMQDIEN
jgi:hypothetical protein